MIENCTAATNWLDVLNTGMVLCFFIGLIGGILFVIWKANQ